MVKCLTQLAMCILPPVALLISLPITLPVIIVRGFMEAMKIWSGRSRHVPSAVELVGMPSSMKTSPVSPKLSRGLVLGDKG